MESTESPGTMYLPQNEEVSIDAMGATRGRLEETSELIVEGYATGSNLDDTLDQIAYERSKPLWRRILTLTV